MSSSRARTATAAGPTAPSRARPDRSARPAGRELRRRRPRRAHQAHRDENHLRAAGRAAPFAKARRGLPRFIADRPGHDRRRAIDAIDAIRREMELRWCAWESFEAGVARTVGWCRNRKPELSYQRGRRRLSGRRDRRPVHRPGASARDVDGPGRPGSMPDCAAGPQTLGSGNLQPPPTVCAGRT